MPDRSEPHTSHCPSGLHAGVVEFDLDLGSGDYDYDFALEASLNSNGGKGGNGNPEVKLDHLASLGVRLRGAFG